jgi:hypothetical protein
VNVNGSSFFFKKHSKPVREKLRIIEQHFKKEVRGFAEQIRTQVGIHRCPALKTDSSRGQAAAFGMSFPCNW